MRKPKKTVSAQADGAAHPRLERHLASGRAKKSAPAGGGAQIVDESQDMIGSPDISSLCMQLQELQVRRKFCIKAQIKLTNAAGNLARRALGFHYENDENENEKVKARASKIVKAALNGKAQAKEDQEIYGAISEELIVVRLALGPLQKRRKEIEKRMTKAAKQLHVAPFAKSVKGLGIDGIALAVIVGEAGDLSNYPHIRKLWKRLGLAPYEGSAYSTWRRKGGLSAEEWSAGGYKPQRLAEIYSCVTESMAKHQLESAKKSGTEFGRAKQKYGEVYVKRREALKTREGMTKAHARMDALRLMTKALVEDLHSVWRGSVSSVAEMPKVGVAPAAPIVAEAA